MTDPQTTDTTTPAAAPASDAYGAPAGSGAPVPVAYRAPSPVSSQYGQWQAPAVDDSGRSQYAQPQYGGYDPNPVVMRTMTEYRAAWGPTPQATPWGLKQATTARPKWFWPTLWTVVGLVALLGGGAIGFAIGHAVGGSTSQVQGGTTNQFPGGTNQFPGGLGGASS